jgi:hypothetical protein
MPYVTLFDISMKPFQWWWLATGLIPLVIGFTSIRVAQRIIANKRVMRIGWGMIILSIYMTVSIFMSTYVPYRRCVNAIPLHQASVVEGVVEDFHPMPYEGHQSEWLLRCYEWVNR